VGPRCRRRDKEMGCARVHHKVGQNGGRRPMEFFYPFSILFSIPFSLFPSLNLNSNLYGSSLQLIFVNLVVLTLDIFIYIYIIYIFIIFLFFLFSNPNFNLGFNPTSDIH
jgi:hypothetical protein